ncbi:Putative serine protease HtrA [Anaerohalosphaera lusitana]|uniref:Putative serine protease HtrA n=1 Tax=Anaerohalosphaera lusitana TaxID=1936003 RepID=A0A1U9NHH9_9BACT|nr:S1C family serine protease [Anaerohalosphaera lusitana]AQT67265.1 Putative serine protease HtrA [Anaerohalosphaera lusitana]
MKTPTKLLFFALAAILTAAPLLHAAPSIFDTADPKDAVVMIRVVKQDYNYVTPWKQEMMQQGVGTGFVIDGNRILTNAHNVANHRYVQVKKRDQAKRYIAKVAFAGHDCDLAILQIDDPTFYEGITPLPIGDIPAENSTVQTLGFPMGGQHISTTEGVVSRIQMGVYSHSQADQHLQVQTDAAINPGNSGGPVMQDGKVVGVAFQGMTNADNIGYMIPTTVIRHFLADCEDGTYDGFGNLGVSTFTGLHNPAYADYLGIPEGTEGLVVTSVLLNSTAEDILQENDVITKIDDYDIDNDGMIKIHGLTLNMAEAIEQKQIGETIDLTFYRDGEQHTKNVTVGLDEPVIAYSRQFDKAPRYHVFAGLTFVPISRNYLESWGGRWISKVPHTLRYLFIDSRELNDNPDRDDYVVLSQVLTDNVNSYTDDFVDKVIKSINDQPIMSLEDVPTAIAKSGDFLTIKFMGQPTPLILDYPEAAARDSKIRSNYNVTKQSNLEETHEAKS